MEGTNPILWPEYSDCQYVDCDKCSMVILGSMFTCNLCDDHHICSNCYNDTIVNETLETNNNEYPKEHPHMSHTYRLDMSPFGKLAYPVHEQPCASCGSKVFPGLRYVCPEICEDYGICATCFIKKQGGEEIEMFEAVQANPRLEKKYQIGAAIVTQKYYGIGLARLDWFQIDQKNEEDCKKLARKIGFAFYQYPTNVPQEERNSLTPDQLEVLIKVIELEATYGNKKEAEKKYQSQFGYTKEQEDHIIKIRAELFNINRRYKKLKNDEPNVLETKFCFVSYFSEGSHSNILPLIIIRINEKRNVFVESTGRAYDGWEDFIDKNKLPECFIIYPNNGLYEMEGGTYLNLRYDISRKSKLPSKIAKVTDNSAMGIGIAATIGSVIGLFTPLAPVAATTLLYTAIGTGIYTMSRSGYHIVDRAIHNENVNPLRTRQNFVDWLAVAASLASFGAIGGSAYLTVMTTNGAEVSHLIEHTVNAAIFASFATSGIALTASGYNIFEKVANGERPTALEIFQFSTSLLFFTNAAVNLQTAEKLIQETAHDKISEARDNIKNDNAKKEFDKTMNDNIKKMDPQQMDGGKSKFIKTIEKMHDAMLAEKNYEAHIREADNPMPVLRRGRPALPSSKIPKMQAGKQLSVNDKKCVEVHLKSLEARSQSKLPCAKQCTTTYLNIPTNEIMARVRSQLITGNAKLKDQEFNNRIHHVITLDNQDDGFFGAIITSVPNGVSIKRGIIDKIDIVLNENDEPVLHLMTGKIRPGTEEKEVRVRLEHRLGSKQKVRMYKADEVTEVPIDDQDICDSYFMYYDWAD